MIKPGFLITAGFSGFLFLALGAMTPFWPLWLADWGLSQAETGALLSFGIIIRVVMGVALPWAADRAGKPRRALALLAAITSLFFLAHEFAGNRFLLYLFTTITSAAIAGMTPIADALTLRAAAKGGFGFATARGVGSATFMLATILCGFAVAAFGPDAILWWLVLCFLPCIPLALHHPGGAGAPLPQPKFGEALALLKRPAFLLTMLASSTLLGGHAVLYTYGSLHWQSQGIPDGVIGGLWAFGVACEVALMFLGGRWLIRRIGPAAALAISGMGGIIRWGFMTMDPGPDLALAPAIPPCPHLHRRFSRWHRHGAADCTGKPRLDSTRHGRGHGRRDGNGTRRVPGLPDLSPLWQRRLLDRGSTFTDRAARLPRADAGKNLKQFQRPEARIPFLADDHMIMQGDADCAKGGINQLRHFDIRL